MKDKKPTVATCKAANANVPKKLAAPTSKTTHQMKKPGMSKFPNNS